MAHAFYTIGHGRRPIGEFVDLLREVDVTLLADFIPAADLFPE
jgi:hypothetical protein